jgi:DNA-directed RNA polymerase specialized sigma24 family protein
LLKQMPQPLRTAMWWRGVEGYTQGQAADEVGLTEKALEGQLGRFRKRIAPAPRQHQNPDSSTHLEEGL